MRLSTIVTYTGRVGSIVLGALITLVVPARSAVHAPPGSPLLKVTVNTFGAVASNRIGSFGHPELPKLTTSI
ncbi:MAG TPA: hypothetical protein VMU65_09325 [Candidatus Saccharimonadales bacterium]|nr:hypothetical protein [Candidatus Saccharimonadales bacterium]